jgi:putative membrane protein
VVRSRAAAVRGDGILVWYGEGMRRHAVLLASVFALLPAPGAAHDGQPPAPHDLWYGWNLDPLLLAGLATMALLYARGLGALWARAGAGRGIGRGRALAFAGGLGVVVVALVSPLDGMSAALFSAHMVQHLLLVLVAAPLLVLGVSAPVWLWALPVAWRRPLARGWRSGRAVWLAVSAPPAAWTLHQAALWLWHLPALYTAALRHAAVHAVEHVALLGTALLFWGALLGAGGRGRLGPGAGVLYLCAASVAGGALAALITFAPAPWYAAYAATAGAWGLTPLEDQQLAGLIMWVPAGAVELLGALILFAVWLGGADEPDAPAPRPADGVEAR